ncbi:high mobility group b protein 4-related [Anaeramoeba flamelloides]|uniref:High mobility group b protein 4-related n=1 Tax=Anaeramoeba flamelloides TaxID=1746091 RepID=A0AAV7Y8K9_9EUKA|nr:high mobility group b protein 4-related [Anaeramoeba flamelloides]
MTQNSQKRKIEKEIAIEQECFHLILNGKKKLRYSVLFNDLQSQIKKKVKNKQQKKLQKRKIVTMNSSRPGGAFFLFLRDFRRQNKKKNKTKKIQQKEISKRASIEWGKLKKSKRNKYNKIIKEQIQEWLNSTKNLENESQRKRKSVPSESVDEEGNHTKKFRPPTRKNDQFPRLFEY